MIFSAKTIGYVFYKKLIVHQNLIEILGVNNGGVNVSGLSALIIQKGLAYGLEMD